MKRSAKLPELLAPAGSPEALYAAVEAGADAIYLGGRHSARAFAANFDEDELLDGVRYAHLHGVRIYLALNTLLFDRELADILPYAARVAATGIDAAIVADVGLMSLLRRHLQGLPLHASTQCFIHSREGADLYHSLGCERVVAARELSLDAIGRLTADCRPEVEVFLHGALCVSHSGQCLFSSLVGGRSGNRGECAQPCRLPYGKGYPLSLRDLALAGHIPALISSGVSSLKIEGRMKSPAYVAGVTSIYRRLLDEGRDATREEWQELTRLFSRSGFTDGYAVGAHQKPMTGIRTEQDKADSKQCEVRFTKTPVKVNGSAKIVADEPSEMTLSLGERSVTVTGSTPTPAKSAPLTVEGARRQLTRLGGTALTLGADELDVTLGDHLFLSAGELNALRRKAVNALIGEEPVPREVVYTPTRLAPVDLPRRVAVCYTGPGARVAEESKFFDRVYLALTAYGENSAPEGVLLPPVITDAEEEEVAALLAAARDGGARYAMCDSYGAIAIARRAGLIPVGGFRLNITNRESLAAVRAMGLEDVLLSPELTAPRLRDLRCRAITYGRIPLMLTERCFIRESFGCEKCGEAALTDRRGVRFPMMREYRHRNLILNSLPTYLADRPDLLSSAGNPPECYLFTVETKKEVAAIIEQARMGEALSTPVRRLPQ